MTKADPRDDAALDARVRAAAAVPFDDIAVTEAVLARSRATRRSGARRQAGWLAWAGPAAFASILVATPFVVAMYPAGDDALLIGLATGDPRALLSGAGLERAVE